MEILMLTNAVGPDKLGGLERYVRELSAALVCAGAAVTVLSKQVDPSHPTTEIGADGVRLIRHPVPPKSSPWFAARYPMSAVGPVLRAVRARPRAVVHAHFPTLALPLELTRRAFVYSFYAPVHRELLSERQGSYTLPLAAQPLAVAALRRAERRVTARATAIVVLSEYAREELAELCPAAATGAHVWPGGLDLDRFTPGPRRRDEWGAAASPLIFTARRLTPRTGVRELLLAMRLVRDRLPNARLAVAGSGGMAGELERLRSQLGLDDAVRMLGFVSEEELIRCYRSADLVVMPTQALEGFGLTTVEALACGTPVVGTPVGATPELLRPVDPRLISRDATPEAIAAAIVAAVEDGELMARVRAGARTSVEGFGWDRMAQRYLELYRGIAALRRAA